MDSLAIKEKKSIALSSVLAGLTLTGVKLIVGLSTNSLGVLSEAAHSGLDLLAALITYFAVSVSDKPPDEDHQYGHGKMENVSALFETILLVITCGWIILEAIERLVTQSSHVEATYWSFAVILLSIVVDISRSRALSRVAKKYGSQALEADALHFSSDIWSSLTVLAGLVLVRLGFVSFDAIAAIVVALLVLFVSYRLGRRTIDALMDRVPTGMARRIEETIENVEGVEEVRSARVRMSGAKMFVDASVAILRTEPFERAHRVMDDIEKAVHAIQPDADVTVHAEPFQGEDETIIDKVRMIVMNKGLRAPHNLEVHRSGGRYFIDFDVEYRRGNSFVEAHALASEIEEQIRQDIPSVEKVTIHLEEFLADEGELARGAVEEQQLSRAISELVLSDKRVLECVDITILEHASYQQVTLTCKLNSVIPLSDVHQIITEIETKLYQSFPHVRRFTIHAEPA